MPLLAAEALGLGHGQPFDADVGESITDVVELERLDHGLDELHGEILSRDRSTSGGDRGRACAQRCRRGRPRPGRGLRDPAPSRDLERVAALLVFGEIETRGLGLFVDAESDDGVGELEQYEACAAGPSRRDEGRSELRADLRADGSVEAQAAEGRRAEDARKHGADEAADAVDAEYVEAVVVAHLLLEGGRIAESPTYRREIDSSEALAGYLGAVENGSAFGSLAADFGVGTNGGSEDHTAILCSRGDRLGQFSYAPVRAERSVPLPPGHLFVIAVSGVHAGKAGEARERYTGPHAPPRSRRDSGERRAAARSPIWRRSPEPLRNTKDMNSTAANEVVPFMISIGLRTQEADQS